MTISCPTCKAENDEPEAQAREAARTCRRCRADLSLLWDLERQRERLMFEAAEALRRREFADAIERAEEAIEIRNDVDAAKLIACVHLLRGKFGRALEWHARAAGEPRA